MLLLLLLLLLFFFFATSVWKVVTSFIVYIHIFFHNESMIELINSIVKKKIYIYIYKTNFTTKKILMCMFYSEFKHNLYIPINSQN